MAKYSFGTPKIIAKYVEGNVNGSVASVTGAVGSVTGNVGGNVNGSVASLVEEIGIFPTKAYSAVYYNASPSNNTYYTALNISGKGVLNKANFVSYGSTAANSLQMKITIDGVAYEFPMTTRGDSRDFAAVSAGASGGYSYNGPIYFNTSIKVEVKQPSGSMTTMEAVCDYALV